MNIFRKFLEPIHLSGDSNPMKILAYRLDGERRECNLRFDAGVSNCNCCDYFTFDRCDNLVLIEDTKLMATIRAKRSELDHLKNFQMSKINEEIDRYVEHDIVLENVVKVYGSLFVLFKFLNSLLICSSSEVCPDIRSIRFWLVANDFLLDESKTWEHYHLKIQNGLYGRLGHNFIESVEVIPKDKLLEKFSRLGCDQQNPVSSTF